jgi:hypothetical protein
MIEQALESLLAPLAPKKTWGFKLPVNTKPPAITFFAVSGPRDQTQQGPSGLVAARYQITSWGTSYREAKLLSKDVRMALDGYRGSMYDVRIDGIELLNEMDDDDPVPDIFKTVMDFRVKYSEDISRNE